MTRVFLRLYLLLVLPLLLLALLPINPITMVGNWWWERIAEREYGAIYSLVMEELENLPQNQWQEKVKDISQHFAYPLTLEKQSNTVLKESVTKRLRKQGYAVNYNEKYPKLIHTVTETDFLLFIGIYEQEDELDRFEKDTRGYRWFLNKKVLSKTTEEEKYKEFYRITKDLAGTPKLNRVEDFDPEGAILKGLLEKGLYTSRDGIKHLNYVLSADKKYVVTTIDDDSVTIVRRYYKYLSTLFPAFLLGIGALFWLLLFRKELTTLKAASAALGRGELQTRTQLSKNSTLYELSHSFNQMAERIQHLLEDHKDLTNAVSHELKTPISRLRFALEMQQESQNKLQRDHYTKKIEQNIEALQNLIDELLSYTRMQRGQDLDLQHYTITDWITEEISLFSDYHPTLDFTHDVQADEQIVFDKLLMNRVLNNLLDNATKHCKSGIKVSARLVLNELVLSVEDDGLGISSEEDCDKIFQPFTRLDKSRQRNQTINYDKGGYGLGLAIVNSIIKLHKGQINCEPSPMGGAAFIVRIPRRLSEN